MQASEKQNIYRSKLVIENKAPEEQNIFRLQKKHVAPLELYVVTG